MDRTTINTLELIQQAQAQGKALLDTMEALTVSFDIPGHMTKTLRQHITMLDIMIDVLGEHGKMLAEEALS